MRRCAIFAFVMTSACGTDLPSALAPIESLPRALTDAEQQVIAGGNDFAFDLLRRVDLAHEGRNVFISPLSASMALGMTLNGARGTTFAGMRTTLGLDALAQPEINASYRDLISLLRTLDGYVELWLASSVWFREGVPVEQDFLDATAQFFDARVGALDFASPEAPATINAWVAGATGGRIPTLIDQLDDSEIMFLVNAIYFEGTWQHRFAEAETRPAAFHLADGGTVSVPMMRRSGQIATAFEPGAIVVELPYGRGPFAMTLLLPRAGETAASLVAGLTSSGWNALLERLSAQEAVLELPRFTLEWTGHLDAPLRELGMDEAFDASRADFSGISQAMYDAGARLQISRVVQKAFIAVDEAGTVASAATVVGVELPSEPPTIRFDRPFVFVIRERLSGTILFVGKVADASRTD